jgi:catechol 2,3-dioxygenase-like lactoylglutathione lyase family enzyme
MNEQTQEWPGRIAAVTLFVDDLEASRTFYADVFGLEVFYEDEDSAVFKFGDTLINLLRETEAPSLVQPAAVAPVGAGPIT